MQKLKILHFITGLDIGGAEGLLLSMLRMFTREKFDVTVCYLKGKGTLRTQFEAEGIRTVFLGERARTLAGRSGQLIRLLREERYDIVHTHLIHATIIGRLAARSVQTPVVLSSELNTSNWQKKYFLATAISKMTERYVDKILVVADAVKQRAIHAGKISPAKIEILYGGIDLKRFDAMIAQCEGEIPSVRDGGRPLLGTVGRLDARKGHASLIKAIPYLLPDFPDLRLVIVGEGKERAHLEALIRTLRLEGHVTLAGTQQSIIPMVKEFDVFVLPSHTEGLPIALLEAMAMQKAVVATEVGGIPEIITNGTDGVLVPPANTPALVDAIRKVLHPQFPVGAMGIAARITIEERFDLRHSVARLETLYDQLIQNAGQKRRAR